MLGMHHCARQEIACTDKQTDRWTVLCLSPSSAPALGLILRASGSLGNQRDNYPGRWLEFLVPCHLRYGPGLYWAGKRSWDGT